MAQLKIGENTVNTIGNLPPVGSDAPSFTLVAPDLKDVNLKDFEGKKILLNIFPSIDTTVCARSVREFNKRAAAISDAVVLCVSKDLPQAHKRFCAAEGIDKVISLSDFRNKGFAKSYGTEMVDGVLAGFHARAIVVIDKQGKIKYTELVPMIGQDPNYDAAINALQ